MATKVLARRTGLYRCSGIGQTIFAKAGEELPAHTNCKGGCRWEFKSRDNPRPEKTTIVIGNKPFFVSIMDKVPEIGSEINLSVGLKGRYRVIVVDILVIINDIWWPHLSVKRVGDCKKGGPVHEVGEVSL